MGKCLFYKRTVRHNGGGQIRQIPFSKKRHGQGSEPLRQTNAHIGAFRIGCHKGGVILDSPENEYYNQQYNAGCHIPGHSQGRSLNPHQRAQKPFHKEEQDAHGEYQPHIGESTGKYGLCQIPSSLFAQGEFFLQILAHAFPPTFHSADV